MRELTITGRAPASTIASQGLRNVEHVIDEAALLEDLTPAQLRAVTTDAAPVCVLASAGAGKTRVLTRRIAYRCLTGRADPSHTLAVTFTRKAARELQDRLGTLGLRSTVAAGTFHAHAAGTLQRWWADRGRSRPTLLERKSRLLGPLLEGRPGFEGVALAQVAALVEWGQARALSPDDLAAAVAAGQGPQWAAAVDPACLGALYRRYQDEKRRRGLIDFDDLLARLVEALVTDAELAEATRWRWRHVYVDEFQDLNPLQHRLLEAWLGSSTDLCVVGDPNQAIYGWNGADPSYLAGMAQRWPGAEVIRLDTNHRSTAQIVTAAASVLGSDGRDLSSGGREGPPPTVRSHPSELAEARAVAFEIRRIRSHGRPWSSMAVLARTNAQLGVFRAALATLGVPSRGPAAGSVLDDPAVVALVDELRSRGHQPVQAALADLPSRRDLPTPTRAAVIELGRVFRASWPEATIAEWLEWLPAGAGAGGEGPGPDGEEDAVTLSTFHRAKGLEWRSVWVVGAEEGLVPMIGPGRRGGSRPSAADPDAGTRLAEERRLLYVALTRATDELSVSWAESRRFGGATVPRQPSRWLEPLVEVCRPPATDTERAGHWREEFDGHRRTLAALSARRRADDGADPALRRALEAWRLETARHHGVPPYAVLHDATLAAVAARRPASLDALLAVPGFGPVKGRRYGEALLAVLTDRRQAG